MRIRINKEKIKRGVIIALPVVFALTAAVAIALLLRPKDEPKTEIPPSEDHVKDEAGGKVDTPVIAPVETPVEGQSQGLEFFSRGNGTCALVGVGECTDRIIVIPSKSPDGEAVVEISVGAFADNKTIVEVSIPDSVVSIGAGAFSNCESLASIVVGEANPLFSSAGGVLFNKSGSTLLCYPSGRKDKVYVLPKSVTRIGEGAFSSCPHLVELKFIGTRAQWSAVYVATGNTGLSSVAVVCTSADK